MALDGLPTAYIHGPPLKRPIFCPFSPDRSAQRSAGRLFFPKSRWISLSGGHDRVVARKKRLTCEGLTWLITGEFMRAVTTLVVFCPCAFILATPTAVLAGIGNAAKVGVIVRSGEALEKLSKIRSVALDKTGTLTTGKPGVTAVKSLDKGCTESALLLRLKDES